MGFGCRIGPVLNFITSKIISFFFCDHRTLPGNNKIEIKCGGDVTISELQTTCADVLKLSDDIEDECKFVYSEKKYE